MTLNDILKREDKFKYQLLSRMKQDCEYFLGNGGRHVKHLWVSEGVDAHIDYMKGIWMDFHKDDIAPEWLTWEEILSYERRMKDEY